MNKNVNELLKDCLKKYKEENFRSALNYLFDNSNIDSVKDVFDSFILEIYRLNNVKYEENPYWHNIIDDIIKNKNHVKAIFDRNRGYKCEMSNADYNSLNFYEKLSKESFYELFNKIVEDLNSRKIDFNLSINDFVFSLFEQEKDRTVNGIYQHLYDYFKYRGIILNNDNNFKDLIKEILDMEESRYISYPLREFNDINMTIVNEKISQLIKVLESFLLSKISLSIMDKITERIEKYYKEMDNITRENNELYAQIEVLRKQIEKNEERKKVLIEEFNKEGAPKK